MMNTRKMLKVALLSVFVGFAATKGVYAQADVSDDELRKYAIVMDSIETMKAVMAEQYNERIKSEELMEGGRRFKAIEDCKGDEAKLAAANVSAEELAVFNEIKQFYDNLVENFKATYPDLIKSDLLGAATYNKVRKALSDSEVKARYESIMSSLKQESDTVVE